MGIFITTMKYISEHINKFANRLGYKASENIYSDNRLCKVDHINKEYDIKNNPLYTFLDILFYNTPKYVYNAIKLSHFNEYFNNKNLESDIYNIITKDEFLLTGRYVDEDLAMLLHPYINNNKRNTFSHNINILLSKAFNEDDNYFGKKLYFTIYAGDFNCVDVEKYKLIELINNIGGILSGSLAMSLYGRVYRTDIKDLDFIVDANELGYSLIKDIKKDIVINKVVGKQRIELENRIKNEITDTAFYKNLHNALGDNLNIKYAFVDRISQYDFETRAVVICEYNGIEFDLMFKDDINYNIIDDIKVQDINDILYTKRLLGRPKDFEDLRLFVPYRRLNNKGKVFVNYE